MIESINKSKDDRINELEKENHNLKEQLQNYIPRRRVRRIYKALNKVLSQDIDRDDKLYLDTIKTFIRPISCEREGICE